MVVDAVSRGPRTRAELRRRIVFVPQEVSDGAQLGPGNSGTQFLGRATEFLDTIGPAKDAGSRDIPDPNFHVDVPRLARQPFV